MENKGARLDALVQWRLVRRAGTFERAVVGESLPAMPGGAVTL